jgi:outer membrane protein assembly factor BamB/orotate phosphoribosyltransferase
VLDNENILKNKIIKECFIQEDAKRAALKSGSLVNWLFDFRRIIFKSSTLEAYSEIFYSRYKDSPPFQVCGIEMAAIPLVISIVMKFSERGKTVNSFIIRKSRKKSGLFKSVEGEVLDLPVIIIDDLINSGESISRQVNVVKGLGKKIKEVFVILRYRDANEYIFLQQDKIPLKSIFELNDFRDTLNIRNLVKKEGKEIIKSPFREIALWYYKENDPNFFYVVPKSGPVVSGGLVFFGTDSGAFFARDIITGRAVWKYQVPFGDNGKYIFSTPVVYKGIIFFGAYDGNMYAFNKLNGKLEWVFLEADWIGSSPCVAEDLGFVFVGLEFGLVQKRGGLVCLNAEDGSKVWEYRLPELTHASPSYSKKFKVIACGSNDGVLYVLNAKTGKLLWSFKTNGEIKYAPSFSEEHNAVVVLGYDNIVFVLDIRSGKIISKYEMGFGGYSTPLVIGEKVVCTSFDKFVHCFNLLTGQFMWKIDTGGRSFASPVLINGLVYVGSNSGKLFEINPKTGTVTGVFYTTERIVNKIAYDPIAEIFFIPTFANEIYAFKKDNNIDIL